MYLLDTMIVSALVRDPHGKLAQRVARAPADGVATSIVCAAELWYGAERSGSARLRSQLEQVLRALPVLPFGDDADRRYGALRAALERKGQVIGGNDMLIAAHALSLDAMLVTDNLREFDRVDGLRTENWLRTTG
ncbi:type II toxin-antitoxin system VapC family toxin [Sphingomonas lenta]|uniref:Ribonuclease VapC n=1 Tax=Sphingomonas lenta TaxID=1141887 RepID=A0A2A2SBR9_9SPHN|nr:type II toxin-antitoxin system VapC family toxin [Sphingomonas lenta]PAX06645.1 VapC toxin family PIN domain ribonuclease [Sphingomonas lenta]